MPHSSSRLQPGTAPITGSSLGRRSPSERVARPSRMSSGERRGGERAMTSVRRGWCGRISPAEACPRPAPAPRARGQVVIGCQLSPECASSTAGSPCSRRQPLNAVSCVCRQLVVRSKSETISPTPATRRRRADSALKSAAYACPTAPPCGCQPMRAARSCTSGRKVGPDTRAYSELCSNL